MHITIAHVSKFFFFSFLFFGEACTNAIYYGHERKYAHAKIKNILKKMSKLNSHDQKGICLSIKLLRFVITCNNGRICIGPNTPPLSSLQNHVFPLVWGSICQPLVFFHFFCCHYFYLINFQIEGLFRASHFFVFFHRKVHAFLTCFVACLLYSPQNFHLKDISNGC